MPAIVGVAYRGGRSGGYTFYVASTYRPSPSIVLTAMVLLDIGRGDFVGFPYEVGVLPGHV